MEQDVAEEAKPDWFDRVLSLVNKRDRRIVAVLVAVIGLGAGSFTVWASAQDKGEAFVDRRIEAKVTQQLADQRKDLDALKERQDTYEKAVGQIGTDIEVIKTLITDIKADIKEHRK